jgi:hypothetical protein
MPIKRIFHGTALDPIMICNDGLKINTTNYFLEGMQKHFEKPISPEFISFFEDFLEKDHISAAESFKIAEGYAINSHILSPCCGTGEDFDLVLMNFCGFETGHYDYDIEERFQLWAEELGLKGCDCKENAICNTKRPIVVEFVEDEKNLEEDWDDNHFIYKDISPTQIKKLYILEPRSKFYQKTDIAKVLNCDQL